VIVNIVDVRNVVGVFGFGMMLAFCSVCNNAIDVL
jgi:hypothetical protein